ncbi:MAG: hypothetical protein JW908_11605 [Anaerolineales bacterium]|nr:hypothetical protein [Anaerolineales bacterium]
MEENHPYCDNCGAVLNPGDRFCDSCGQPVNGGGAPEQSPVTGVSRAQAKSHSSNYFKQRLAWSFLFGLLLIPIVFVLIWRDVGEFTTDVWLSLLGFIVVTTVLAYFTLRSANKTWQGELEEVIARENGTQFVFRTDQGKRIRIIGSAELADYFHPGDRVVKIKGYDYPEKIERKDGQQICVACGKVFAITEKRCQACRYPSINPRNYI